MADIFDRMLDGINKGVNSVATSSKSVIEKAKINTVISNLEGEKRAVAEQMGAAAYNLYKEGKLQNLEELGAFCEQIDSKIEEIKAKQQELEALDAPAHAPQQTVADAAQGGMFCGQCGNKNTPEAKFCAKCGAKLI